MIQLFPLPKYLWSCHHLFPDLGEGLEDGWQVEVLGRVQVTSDVVHHLKSGLHKKRNKGTRETEGFLEKQEKQFTVKMQSLRKGVLFWKSSKSLPYCRISSGLANCIKHVVSITIISGHDQYQQMYQISRDISVDTIISFIQYVSPGSYDGSCQVRPPRWGCLYG